MKALSQDIMPNEVVFVKNMVCHRCILTVENILKELSLPFQQVTTGEIHLTAILKPQEYHLLASSLEKTGLKLIDNKASGLIEKIKQLIISKARNEVAEKEIKLKLSVYLSQQLHHEYTYLSSFFSSVESRTIENYFIEQRIEKVKELLVYNEMTLSQIAFDMEYSSVAHLSNQFKKTTGLTPSYFKQLGSKKRRSLDQV